MAEYRFVGAHPVEVQKGEKVIPIGPGDFVELTADELKENPDLKDDLLDVGKAGKS